MSFSGRRQVVVNLRLTKHDSVLLQLVGLGKDSGFWDQQLLLEVLIALLALCQLGAQVLRGAREAKLWLRPGVMGLRLVTQLWKEPAQGQGPLSSSPGSGGRFALWALCTSSMCLSLTLLIPLGSYLLSRLSTWRAGVMFYSSLLLQHTAPCHPSLWGTLSKCLFNGWKEKGWNPPLISPCIPTQLFSQSPPQSILLNPQQAMAPHSSTLAWKITWMEEPGGLQSMGLLRVGHDWATSLSLFTFRYWRRKWQPTPVFLPEESQGQGSLVGCRLWGCTESDTTDAT